MNPAVRAFAIEARAYCDWARNIQPGDPGAAEALRRISGLYRAALELPALVVKGVADEPSCAEGIDREAVVAACARLPLQYYSEQFDPLAVAALDEAVMGDVADDIADIFLDVCRGLRFFDAGFVEAAVWEWAFHFQIHWGRHAVCALRALHAYVSEHCRERLLHGV